jgi:hypothetical protein
MNEIKGKQLAAKVQLSSQLPLPNFNPEKGGRKFVENN